ncbi:helix-turn-helix domain-containing protein [Melghirimyces algeriensis]|uniref:Helix-turn-helix domain-containing protein n=1 Tax=Melghirimyces algeriensis TaxID=910412 RepID=A0A521AW09_9BACL|nr:helix-turn-helix domain-containing protein [Melghirimyces algeriensis]SMO39009.1 Helix-turn-helix domain-containing protein [Melghirimyces algeriensis]
MWKQIGQQLKEARMNTGLTLDQLQDLTRISRADLSALENGQFEKLPSPFYVRSYLRSYASQVGLEPTKLLKQYRATEQTPTDNLPSSKNETNRMDTGKQATHPKSKFSQQSGSIPHTTGSVTATPNNQPQYASDQESFPSSKSLPNYDWKDFLEQEESSLPESHPQPEFSSSPSVDSYRKTRKLRKKLPIWAILTGILLLIPLGLWTGGILGNGNHSSANHHTAQTKKGSVQATHASTPGGMALINRDNKKSVYELTNNQDLELEVTSTGKCWIQIKENEDGGYLKDLTLNEEDPPFRFTHPKSVTTDLWIFLGEPDHAQITINGQSLSPSEVIHIKKIQ